MAKTYYDADADLNLIRARKVAIIGYGSQGHAHALNLNDSGVQVQVGLKAQSQTREQVTRDGLQVRSVSEVAEWGDVIVLLAPDTIQPRIYTEQVAPHLGPGKTLMFSHGFNIRYGTIDPARRSMSPW